MTSEVANSKEFSRKSVNKLGSGLDIMSAAGQVNTIAAQQDNTVSHSKSPSKA